MMILPELKVGFVHIYKTGGTTLTELLAPHTSDQYRSADPRLNGPGFQATWHFGGAQHSMFSNPKKGFPKELHAQIKDWKFLAVTRSPYTWSFSLYKTFFEKDAGQNSGTNFDFGQKYPERRLEDFYKFVVEHRSHHPRAFGVTTQTAFLRGIPRDQLSLIRFEHYEDDVQRILPSLGIDVPKISHRLNRGDSKRQQATALMEDLSHVAFCNAAYERDFKRFKFDKVEL